MYYKQKLKESEENIVLKKISECTFKPKTNHQNDSTTNKGV